MMAITIAKDIHNLGGEDGSKVTRSASEAGILAADRMLGRCLSTIIPSYAWRLGRCGKSAWAGHPQEAGGGPGTFKFEVLATIGTIGFDHRRGATRLRATAPASTQRSATCSIFAIASERVAT